ncbi:20S rRNA accumulation protein [Trichophyton mentagrophytes]|nr:20S rRNA accumulation protein [Trichophyton mentagrophytes]
MDSYDSDSSGIDEELDDYTETGVLLGYASKEELSDAISHLGGWPTWLDPATPPPGNFAKCKVCNDPMPLLLQLNGDLPEHFAHDERWLYIFGCVRRTCSRKKGSIRALRAVKRHKTVEEREKVFEKQKEEAQNKPKRDLGADLFGVKSPSDASGSSNPFSTSSIGGGNSPANPFASLPPTSSLAAVVPQKPDDETMTSPESAGESLPETFAQKASISAQSSKPVAGPQAPWPEQSAFPPPYPHYFFDAEYEALSKTEAPVPSNVKIDTLEAENEGSSSTGTKESEKELFESSMDKSFIRFSTRLEHNPEQVLRYEFRGTPLLYSTSDEVGKLFALENTSQAQSNVKVQVSGSKGSSKIPRCETCGSERVFELQLVPHAIAMLEEGMEGIGLGPKDDLGMEWGTIILSVCAADCAPETIGEAGWREEWVGVQWEERLQPK